MSGTDSTGQLVNTTEATMPAPSAAFALRDADVSHFEYFTLAILSEAPGRALRMTELARRTDSTLPRLSHVVSRLEARGFIERSPCPEDRRATNAALTETGWQKVVDTAPGQTLLFRALIRDRKAFLRSLEPLRGWDFDRVTMTHNDVAEHGGRAATGAVLGWKE